MLGPSALGFTGYEVEDHAANQVKIRFSKFINNVGGYAVLTPVEVWNLEQLFDNGKPGGSLADVSNNNMRGQDGTNASGVCISSGAYDLNNESGVACVLWQLLNANL
jgi:hypothetical protein